MRALLVALLLFPLAGCLDAEPAPVDDVEVEPAPVEGIPVVEETATDGVDDLSDIHPLQNITEFAWSADGVLGDVAFELTVDFGTRNACHISEGVTGQTEDGGTLAVFFSSAGAWTATSASLLATVSVGSVDTRDIFARGGIYGSAGGIRGTYDGEVTFTHVARGVQTVPELEDFFPHAMAIGIHCDDPFDVLGARTGTAVVGDTSNLDGMIVETMATGGAAFGTRAEDLTGEGHVRFGSFGDQAGFVTLRSPEESVSATLPLERAAHLAGPAGTYQIDVDRAAATFEAFWFTMYGLTDTVDLMPGLQRDASGGSPA